MKGFTLMELLIVVTIIGILGAIAYPMYTDQVIRGKRAEGRALLADSAAKMERWYSDCNKYPDTIVSTSNNCTNSEIKMDSSSENGHYDLAITNVSGNQQQFTLTATPADFNDAECDVLSLTEAGAKSQSGTGDQHACWGR